MARKTTAIALAALPLAFVVGGLVGAWKPLDELRALKESPKAEEAKPAVAGFDSFARMVNIPDAARKPRRARRRAEAAGDKSAPDGGEAKAEPAPAAERESADRPAPPPREFRPEDLQARIDEARELWNVRADVLRSQLAEKFRLDGAGRESFNAAIDNMNAKLRDSMEAIASILDTQEKMTPELGVRLMGDLSTAIAETYDEVGACVDPSLRDAVSESEFFGLIDPGVAEPLIRVQGKVNRGMGIRFGGGR